MAKVTYFVAFMLYRSFALIAAAETLLISTIFQRLCVGARPPPVPPLCQRRQGWPSYCPNKTENAPLK